jgi:hypothetical protein
VAGRYLIALKAGSNQAFIFQQILICLFLPPVEICLVNG